MSINFDEFRGKQDVRFRCRDAKLSVRGLQVPPRRRFHTASVIRGRVHVPNLYSGRQTMANNSVRFFPSDFLITDNIIVACVTSAQGRVRRRRHSELFGGKKKKKKPRRLTGNPSSDDMLLNLSGTRAARMILNTNYYRRRRREIKNKKKIKSLFSTCGGAATSMRARGGGGQ